LLGWLGVDEQDGTSNPYPPRNLIDAAMSWGARPMRLISQPLAALRLSQESARGTAQLVERKSCMLAARSGSLMRRNFKCKGLS
jgi:hypothetical protein